MPAFKAILFDLDGTLLDSNMEVFLPHYLKRLAGRLAAAGIAPPEQFVPHLMAATQAMVVNNGPATNEAVFAAAFYPFAGHDRAELEPLFENFYAADFPKLRDLTRPKPDARPAVEAAFARGRDVVIATHPVFPATAVRQRLAWAGVADLPYRWITSFENSRAAKPNPRYFLGICEAIGRAPQECLMVGDEAMDMAAAAVGMTTFLVGSPATALPGDVPSPAYRGTLADLTRLLEGKAAP